MSENIVIQNLTNKIINDFKLTVKEKTDNLLQLDAIQYTNLGIDSTKVEKNKVKKNSKYIYKQIESINKPFGKLLINSMDG